MPAPTVQLLDGYPQAEGAKWGAVADVVGPASYVTGGFTLSAVSFGMAQFDHVSGGIGAAGIHRYDVTAPNASDLPAPTVTVKSFVISTGAEVAAGFNLSASHFRVRAIGI
jgi:hypothetical protein